MQQMLRASQQLMGPSRCAAASSRLFNAAPKQRAFAPQRQPLQARAYTGEAADVDDTDAVADQPYGGTAVFTKWAVYKGKGALNVKPMRPRWTRTDKGGWQLDKEGGFSFELANSVGGGERRYDWSNKILIALRPLELSEIITEPQKEHTFYHDTFKNQPGREGTLVKTLKWSPADSGYFISASMTDKTQGQEKKASVSCSITPAEFTIFEQLVRGCIGNMHGFDVAWGPF